MSELPVAAWRCEECHDWHPASEDVHSILVLEIGPDVGKGEYMERAYVPRLIRICSDCRAAVTGEKLGFSQ